MTEDQACGKMCQVTFASDQASRCIGSICMAWRWSEAKRTEAFLEATHTYVKEHKVPFSKASQAVWDERGPSFQKVDGFCGLAGEP